MNEQALSTSQNYSIAELRTRVKAGQLRVPQFQRSFRWERRDVLNLVDSVLRGYPIGSLLLWKREAEAERLRIGRKMNHSIWHTLSDKSWHITCNKLITVWCKHDVPTSPDKFFSYW